MQCIHRPPNVLTMATRALGLALLFSLVTALFGLPTPDQIANNEEHTLSTELQPPPVDEKEHYVTVYVINLYAVKNRNGTTSKEMFQNEVIEAVPDIVMPLATVLLVVEDKEEEREQHSDVNFNEFAEGLEGRGFKVDKINLNQAKVLKVKLEKGEARNMVESILKPGDEMKDRAKRAVCLRCKREAQYGYGRGGHGGYPSGGEYYPNGGGGSDYYPSGSESEGGYYPPSSDGGHRGGGHWGGGHWGGGHHGGGHWGGGHRGGWGGGHRGGCYRCGGGGGESYAQSSAQASAGSWGGK